MTRTNSYRLARPLLASLILAAFAASCGGGGGGGRDTIFGTDAGSIAFVPPTGATAPGVVCPQASLTTPAVISSTPTNGNQLATTSTSGVANGGKTISANFNIAMDAATITPVSFILAPAGGAALVPASFGYSAPSMAASLNTSSALLANTSYTAVIQNTVKSAAGTPLGCNYSWTFRTAAVAAAGPAALNLGSVERFGVFGGTKGMTNSGNQTVITGSGGNTADIRTVATETDSITGFHDSNSDIYTETIGVNEGNVTGRIYTCAESTNGPTSTGPNAASCRIATQARLDAQAAYLALAALPPGANPGADLSGLTLAPGVYTSPSSSFMILSSDLTLDAKGDANASWVFQMATSLNVGAPAVPRSVRLINGAQAKNVSWQVGSAATINASGGGTMEGTILTQTGASFSTADNKNPVTLDGRVLSLGASVTMVNTLINVPAP